MSLLHRRILPALPHLLVLAALLQGSPARAQGDITCQDLAYPAEVERCLRLARNQVLGPGRIRPLPAPLLPPETRGLALDRDPRVGEAQPTGRRDFVQRPLVLEMPEYSLPSGGARGRGGGCPSGTVPVKLRGGSTLCRRLLN